MAPSKHKELGTKRFVNRGTVVTCPPRQDAQARKHTPRPKTPVSRKASSRPLQRFLSCSQPSLSALTCLKIQICKRSFVHHPTTHLHVWHFDRAKYAASSFISGICSATKRWPDGISLSQQLGPTALQQFFTEGFHWHGNCNEVAGLLH